MRHLGAAERRLSNIGLRVLVFGTGEICGILGDNLLNGTDQIQEEKNGENSEAQKKRYLILFAARAPFTSTRTPCWLSRGNAINAGTNGLPNRKVGSVPRPPSPFPVRRRTPCLLPVLPRDARCLCDAARRSSS